ncbi:hypothetical protein LTR17_020220 [Elasticomyces elasticus]|nr:hypothetical protein LTR17_020220 [Elasticomyces elasticus]
MSADAGQDWRRRSMVTDALSSHSGSGPQNVNSATGVQRNYNFSGGSNNNQFNADTIFYMERDSQLATVNEQHRSRSLRVRVLDIILSLNPILAILSMIPRWGHLRRWTLDLTFNDGGRITTYGTIGSGICNLWKCDSEILTVKFRPNLLVSSFELFERRDGVLKRHQNSAGSWDVTARKYCSYRVF